MGKPDPAVEETAVTVVYLGNRHAVETIRDEDGTPQRRVMSPAKRCTTVVLPAGTTLFDAAHDIVHSRGVWQAHSDADKPAWVASTDPDLAKLLASHWGTELRDPDPDHGQPTDGGGA
jgi:hypothetical protein